jgi:hypothetical protein
MVQEQTMDEMPLEQEPSEDYKSPDNTKKKFGNLPPDLSNNHCVGISCRWDWRLFLV